MSKTFFVFLGPPGSGKGTQAELLSKEKNLPILSTGQILRKAQEEDSDLGRKLKAILNSGQLVPDEIIEEIINNELSQEGSQNGIIFDGYPRTQAQNISLMGRLASITGEDDKVHHKGMINCVAREGGLGHKIYALFVDVSDEEVQHRLGGRRSCACGATYHLDYNPPKEDEICDVCSKKMCIREDDKPEVISARLKVYYDNIDPVLKNLEDTGKLIKINGEQSISDVYKEIKGHIV